jgi:hypothetical protein
MSKTPEWLFVGVALIWCVAPWMLTAFGWRKWAQTCGRSGLIEGFIDDPAFLIGQILGTLSCLALVPLYAPATFRWEWLRVDAVNYGLILCIVSTLVALFVLPFGRNRAKWLILAGCVLNAGIVFGLFFLSLE